MPPARARPPSVAAPSEVKFGLEEVVARLYRNGDEAVHELIAAMVPLQRANLAMLCYHKAHLHRIGLAIAASCEESTLIEAFGSSLGRILYAQSREYAREAARFPGRFKSQVTLAAAPRISRLFADIDEHVADRRPPEQVIARRSSPRLRAGSGAPSRWKHAEPRHAVTTD
jgi:hypothetical protein